MNRRELIINGALALAALSTNGWTKQDNDAALLDEVERASFDFFWKEASSKTGQVKDRADADKQDTRRMSSIAATGFGLSALCIADQRRYLPHAQIVDRVKRTLSFLAQDLEHVHGFYYTS